MGQSRFCFAIAFYLLLASVWSMARGQPKASSSVQDGVYTAAQAERGETAYRANCASCHGADLEGKGQNPPLAGSDFTGNWNGRTLGELFDKMQDTMPADRPGKLDRPVNAAILAYILKANKFPAGKAELEGNSAALTGIVFRSEAK